MLNLTACLYFSIRYCRLLLFYLCVCTSLHMCHQCESTCALCVFVCMSERESECTRKPCVNKCACSVYVLFGVCVSVSACVYVGIIWRSGSEEGQGIKDHKKCMTADNFRLLIKICWYDQSLGLSQTHSRDSGLPGCAADRTTRQLTESGGTGAFSSSPALPPRWNPSN